MYENASTYNISINTDATVSNGDILCLCSKTVTSHQNVVDEALASKRVVVLKIFLAFAKSLHM